MKYKKRSASEKLEILKESEEYSVVEICRKHGVSTSTFYSWRKKFDYKGAKGLKAQHETKTI